MKLFKWNKKTEKKDNSVKEDIIDEQQELIDYLKEKKKKHIKEIRALQENVVDLEKKMLTSDLDYAKACDEINARDKQIELLEDRIDYLEKTIKQYHKMPDLKNMIDNLSSLTTPSIDKLVEIMKDNDFENLSDLKDKLDNVVQEIRSFRREMYDGAKYMRF